MLNRRIIRTIFNTTETTDKTSSISSDTLDFNLQTTDSFYVGYHLPFASRYFYMNVVNTVASVLTVEFWNGTAWTAVDDLIDQTSTGGKTMGQSGFVSWVNDGTWQPRSLTGIDTDVELYWVKLTVSVNLLAGTKLQSVLNLFSDDNLLRAYYPEIVTDTRYLPSGRTDFIEQHVSARDLCILRLKQRKVIDDAGQIIDPNELAIAATHACAWAILNPIATSEQARLMRDDTQENFEKEISLLNFATDSNKDGVISNSERSSIVSMRIFRR